MPIFTYFQYSLIHDLADNALTYKTAVCDNGKFCKWVDFDLKWVVSAKLQTIEQQLSWTASLLSQGSNLRGSQFECCNSRKIRVYSSFVNLKFIGMFLPHFTRYFWINLPSLLVHQVLINRAGSGHFFHGVGRVSGLRFWLGSGSGYWKCPQVNYGP